MAGFLQGFQQGFSPSFTRGMGMAMQRDQFDQEMGLRRAADARVAERHEADMSRIRSDAARQSQYDADLGVALDAQNLGVVDRQGTAASQATAGLQAADMNSPSGMYDAAPAAPVARGMKAPRGQTSRALAEAGLRAGKLDIPQYNAAGDQARGYDVQDIMGNLAAQFAKDPQGVWGASAVKYNPADSGVPIIAEDINPATGKARLTYTDKGGKGRSIELTPAQQLKLLQAERLLQSGFGVEAQKMMSEVDSHMADIILKGNAAVKDVFNANTDAGYKEGMLKNDAAKVAVLRDRANKENAQLRKIEEGLKLGQEAEGAAQGFRTAKGLGKEGAAAAKLYDTMYQGYRVRGAGLGLRLPDLVQKPEFDPVKYATTLKDLVLSGMKEPEARMLADEMFGRGNDDEAILDSLRQLSANKDATKGGLVGPSEPAVGIRKTDQQYVDEGAARMRDYQARQAAYQEQLRQRQAARPGPATPAWMQPQYR